jgi:hypothetical protein
VCALVAAWAWTRPVGEPLRAPAVVLASAALLLAISAAIRLETRALTRAANIARSAALVFVIASWDGPPWWASLLAAAAIGAFDARAARAGERSMAGVAIGGAAAVAWNAWRFGAPPQRVFAVAVSAAVALAVTRPRTTEGS